MKIYEKNYTVVNLNSTNFRYIRPSVATKNSIETGENYAIA